MFSNNQNSTTALDFEWWTGTFKSAIENIGYTVVVLAPWNDPIPLQRAWCLFEMYCTAATGSRFEIAMSPNEEIAFLDDLVSDSGVINRMLAQIDVQKSEATVQEDKDRIFQIVTDVGRLIVSSTYSIDSISCL